MLIFKIQNDQQNFAVPLALISRLEEFSMENLEVVDGKYVIQYRNKLLPLVAINDNCIDSYLKLPKAKAIIFSDENKSMGIWVYEIVDIVEDNLQLNTKSNHPGFLGGAIISHKATEVIDAYHYITKAYPDWFKKSVNENKATKANILLVEDSMFFKNLLKPILESNGYMIFWASNGQNGLNLLQKNQNIQLIITDLEMPEMDGFTMIEKIKTTNNKNLPIIILSSLNSIESVNRASQLEVNEYLVKFDEKELLESIDKILNIAKEQK